MLVSELYTNLEENIINIFNQINKNENVRYLKPKEGKGLYIVFGKLEIRSSIRIYPTKDNNNFSYAIGNKQYIIKDSEIILLMSEKSILLIVYQLIKKNEKKIIKILKNNY